MHTSGVTFYSIFIFLNMLCTLHMVSFEQHMETISLTMIFLSFVLESLAAFKFEF